MTLSKIVRIQRGGIEVTKRLPNHKYGLNLPFLHHKVAPRPQKWPESAKKDTKSSQIYHDSSLSGDELKPLWVPAAKGQILAVAQMLHHKVFGLFKKLPRKLASLSGTHCLLSERAKCFRTSPSVYHFAR